MNSFHTGLLIAAALGLAVGAGAASTSDTDKAFVQKAIAGDSGEILLGKIAQSRGKTVGVRSFGAMLVADHSEGRKEALHTAAAIGLTATLAPPAEATEEKAKLLALSGSAFDSEFARYMVTDHEEDIADFQKEARDGQGPAAALARTTIPTLEKHLSAARRLANTAG